MSAWNHYMIDLKRIIEHETRPLSDKSNKLKRLREIARGKGLIFQQTEQQVGRYWGWAARDEHNIIVGKLAPLREHLNDLEAGKVSFS